MTTKYSMIDSAAKLIFYCLILVAPACGGGGGEAAPPAAPPQSSGFVYELPDDLGDSWAVGHADDQGVDAAAIEAMMDAILGGGFDAIDSVAIARNGRLVFDQTIRTELDEQDDRVNNS